jgi:hypothetical protein
MLPGLIGMDRLTSMFTGWTIWSWLIAAYIILALLTFLPSLWAILFNAKLYDVGSSFDDSPHFSESAKATLKQHYSRIYGTLIFWKSAARKYARFHDYSLCWTIFSSAIVPFLNAWCEMEARYQSTRSATARLGRPSCSFNQIQKLCSVILAANRA